MAGNSAGFMIPVTADNLILSNITTSSHTIDTSAAETSVISFSINAPATVTFKIIPEKQGVSGTPVYQSSQVMTAAGASSFTWDGKDSTTKVVPDGTGSITCSQSEYNPITNMPMTITYTPSQPSRVTITVAWGTQNYKLIDALPSLATTNTFDWIGMNTSQKALANGAAATCTINSLLPENHIITTGDTPKVTMLKTDPYQLSLAYGQFSRIKYTLSRQSNVTIKLVSPSGVSNTLVNNLPQTSGSYELEWTSTNLTDESGKSFFVAEDGDYTVSIQATNPVTGTNSTTKGNLRVGL